MPKERSESGYRNLLDVNLAKDKQLHVDNNNDYNHQIFREYLPSKRTVVFYNYGSDENGNEIGQVHKTLNFPYLIFAIAGNRYYSYLRVAMAKRPITSFRSKVYFPAIWNIYENRGGWGACGVEGNGVSIKNLNILIDYFWNSVFTSDSHDANVAIKYLYGSNVTTVKPVQKSKTKTAVLKNLKAKRKRNSYTFEEWVNKGWMFYSPPFVRTMPKNLEKQLKKVEYIEDIIIQDV